jgi:hypothetical protein
VRICEEFGRKVATADEAREILKVGVWYNSVEETLMNLGLPPNRRDGEKGFLVWDTDGKKTIAKTAGDSHPMAYCMAPPQAAKAAMAAKAKTPAWASHRRGRRGLGPPPTPSGPNEAERDNRSRV